ncbi:hypothetical protein DQM68_18445 [Leptospira mayottensis]|uniref:Uncharacterized protein n=2 Tax=Leptospira mayottensis TaxID=1137606 RepID=A0AA87SWG7_9LEPT|nr:hypothetical protein DQM68_18445 [Leptospira mayottensis]AXR66442.1 hypothetical protein DQM28_19780 [Leptospira mayottensis]AZQ04046.1 hypothetical protein LEP1GSC190_18520 [Leptospira mayottensis 200901116]EKS00034.1 hypothetical protein LEP1GSC125_3539 [Leptospira mayottensis 200901122]
MQYRYICQGDIFPFSTRTERGDEVRAALLKQLVISTIIFLVSQNFWVARRSSSILCLSINGFFVSELTSFFYTFTKITH